MTMAGVGPAPKDPSKRARKNADPIPTRRVPLIRAEAPELPAGYDWHERTLDWWSMWARSPLSADFTEADWYFLTDTAKIHSAFWSGDMKAAPELRVRVAKFGMTPEDRARLRIVFADAEEKDQRRGTSVPSASARYGGLRAVGAPAPDPSVTED